MGGERGRERNCVCVCVCEREKERVSWKKRVRESLRQVEGEQGGGGV